MFYLNRETKLTPDLLQKIINRFTVNVQPKLQKWKNYYDGKHAILTKSYPDPSKPCNKIITNLCKVITDSYCGYIAGKPVTYTSNDDIADVQEVINYNDSETADMLWCTNTLIFGIGYELQWIDEMAQVRYGQVSPLNSFAIYDNSLDKELLYFVRWYKIDDFDNDDKMCIEVYDSFARTTYHSTGLGSALTFIEKAPHFFRDVPVSVFHLNDDVISIFAQVITLQDAYNEIQSSEADDYQSFVDSYLLLKGVGLSPDDVDEMRSKRVIQAPVDSEVSFLTKNVSDVQVQNMLENIRKNIFKITACPDMGDENFMAQSGIAIRYKLVNFENLAANIVARFTKAIQRRIELICNVLNLKASEAVWRDIHINFVRNLPQDLTETVNLVNSLKGIVSDATLLSQIPFVDDVDAELEALKAQKEENMAMYDFGGFGGNQQTEEDEAV